jgi:hypothetical protein
LGGERRLKTRENGEKGGNGEEKKQGRRTDTKEEASAKEMRPAVGEGGPVRGVRGGRKTSAGMAKEKKKRKERKGKRTRCNREQR